jgi:hypothetical protein
MKRTFMLLAAGLALALTLGAAPAFAKPDCGENTGQKATGKPIPIGGVTSMSGIGSFKEAGDAAEAYFKCVNDNGGIHGRPITYHAEDDQSQLDVAAQAAKKLVEDEGVYMMIGSTSFIECIPNANYYLKNNILEIGLGIPSQCRDQCRTAAERHRRRRVRTAQARRQNPGLFDSEIPRLRLQLQWIGGMGQEVRRQGDEYLFGSDLAGL